VQAVQLVKLAGEKGREKVNWRSLSARLKNSKQYISSVLQGGRQGEGATAGKGGPHFLGVVKKPGKTG